MAKRLSVKHRKNRRNKERAYTEGKAPARHKVAKTRSKKHLFRANHPMT